MSEQKDLNPLNNPEQVLKRTAREIFWKEQLLETAQMTDAIDYPVETLIRKMVNALRIYGFSTSQSCEGHVYQKERMVSFPWVECCTSESQDLETSENKRKEWRKKGLHEQQKIMLHMEEFYQFRQTSFDARLTLVTAGGYGGFKIQSYGSEIMELLTFEEQVKKLEIYRKEMDDFADFLKNKFLQQ